MDQPPGTDHHSRILDRYDAETKRVPFYMTQIVSHMPPDGPIYGFRSDQWHDPIDDDDTTEPPVDHPDEIRTVSPTQPPLHLPGGM